MNFYNKVQINDNEILLQKIIINFDDYDIINLENGDIKLIKKKLITINSIDELKQYNFKKSVINKCLINNKEIFKYKYKSILNHIYILINDGTKIIKNTILNIKTISKNDNGFDYIPELGISVQRVDSDKCIKEILIQSILNNINISIDITLSNNIKLNLIS